MKSDEVKQRLAHARRLAQDGDYDAATAEFVWLWQNMLAIRPSMFGVRHSFLVDDLAALVKEHAPARTAFTALRDAAAPHLGEDALDPSPPEDGAMPDASTTIRFESSVSWPNCGTRPRVYRTKGFTKKRRAN